MGDARKVRASTLVRRYGAGVALPVVLVAGAGWAWAHAPDTGSASPDRVVAGAEPATTAPPSSAPSNQPSRPSRPSAGSTPAATSAPGSSTSQGADASSGTAVPRSGPGITDPGTNLTVAPRPDGDLDVTERVVLPAVRSRLPLRPPDLADAGSSFGQARPVATGVQLTVDGQPMPIGDGRVAARQVVEVGRPASVLELRYVLTRATVRSVPSLSGRALAAVRPLVAVGGAPVVVTTSGDTVLNLSCPLLTGDARSCSDGARGTMAVRTPLPAGRALVVLQLDLSGS